MSVITTKKNGKIDSLQIYGNELEPFLSLIQKLWNDCELSTNDACHSRGICTLQMLLKDYQ